MPSYFNPERRTYFERIKGIDGIGRIPKGIHVFFDCETCQIYEEGETEPLIVPYLIGVTDEVTKQFKYFVGLDASEQFFKYITGEKTYKEEDGSIVTLSDIICERRERDEEGKYTKLEKDYLNRVATLTAYNFNYDFHAIRVFIQHLHKKYVDLLYNMDEKKKFIGGHLKSISKKLLKERGVTEPTPFKRQFNYGFRDLWMFDRSKSLGDRIEGIRAMIFDSDGKLIKCKYDKDKEPDPRWIICKAFLEYGLDYDTFKKGSLGTDYTKVQLHKREDGYYYWSSYQSYLDKEKPKKLDMEHEIKYLKGDVLSLPVLLAEEKMIKWESEKACEIRDWKTNRKPRDANNSITAPGHAKYLIEEQMNMFMTQFYRPKVYEFEYEMMVKSYCGGFTAHNKDLTYVDEEVFKTLYPNVEFKENKPYIVKGEVLSDWTPRIRAYDINSEYPSVMYEGVPYGYLTHIKPKGKNGVDYCTWYEVNFYDYVDEENGVVIKWKDQYKFISNSFLGNDFLVKAGSNVTKYMCDFYYELMEKTCVGYWRINTVLYQPLDTVYFRNFIEPLYDIKCNLGKKHSKVEEVTAKLMMNSSYGKTAEKFREWKIVFSNNLSYYINKEIKKWVENSGEIYPSIIDPFTKKEVDSEEDVGFAKLPNCEKRFDAEFCECRESIMTGLYITQRSRWLLQSAIITEINNGNTFLNCDTDSIKILEVNPPKISIDDIKLGYFKFEGAYTHFGHPNSHKKYFLFNDDKNLPMKVALKVAVSGFPKVQLIRSDTPRDEVLNILRTSYATNNCVIIRNGRTSVKWSKKYHQMIISNVDVKIAGNLEIPVSKGGKYTHEIINGVLTKIE